MVQAIVWALLNSSWQSALLWFAYLWFYQNRTTASKKQFLLTAITAQVISTICIFLFHLARKQPLYSISFAPSYHWEPYLLALYLSILAIRLMQACFSFNTFNQWHKGLMKAPATLQLFTAQQAALLGIKRKVNLWISNQNLVPHARGFLKPIVVLPASLLLNLSPRETEAIILHELAHIRHRDLLSNYLVIFAELVYYFNPFTVMMIREFRLQREIRCDERVLDFGYPVAGYCQALYLTALNYIQEPSYTLSLTGSESDLLKRIRNMVNNPAKKNKKGALFMLPFLSVLLLTGIFIKPTTETIADRSPSEEMVKTGIQPTKAGSELPMPVQTRAIVGLNKKSSPSLSKAKKVMKDVEIEKDISIDTVTPEAIFVNYTLPVQEKEIVIVEKGSDGKTVKMFFILQAINGTPQIIPLIQFIQTLPDSSQHLKDSIAEF